MITRHDFTPDLHDAWDTYLAKNDSRPTFYTFNWHVNWYHTLARDWKPFVLTYRDCILIPFAKKGNSVELSGGTEVSDYMDILGPDEEKHNAWSELMQYLPTQNIHTITLRNIPETSATYTWFLKHASQFGGTITQEDTTPRVSLPATWEEYVSSLSRKHRHELRRKLRKFEREHPNARITTSSNKGEDLALLFTLMRRNADKQTFLTPEMEEFFKGFTHMCHECVEIFTLRIQEEPASMILCLNDPKTVYLYNSGFDEGKFSGAGFYLKAMSIKHAIEEAKSEYNFLQGNERYKYELGGVDSYVYRIDVQIP